MSKQYLERRLNREPVENPHSKYYYVYMIRNTKNGRMYIGQSANIEERFKAHLSNLKHHRHTSKLLQEDFDNGSEKDFEVIEIEKCICSLEAHALEEMYMVIYKTYDERFGYNGRDARFYSNMHNKESKFLEFVREEAAKY